jgi:hypothetical protein
VRDASVIGNRRIADDARITTTNEHKVLGTNAAGEGTDAGQNAGDQSITAVSKRDSGSNASVGKDLLAPVLRHLNLATEQVSGANLEREFRAERETVPSKSSTEDLLMPHVVWAGRSVDVVAFIGGLATESRDFEGVAGRILSSCDRHDTKATD